MVKRSRFLTSLGHAADESDVRAFIASVREDHPGATHHCWAYNLGPPGDTARIGMSDDGEPRGTAGRPMLSALLHADIGEVVAVCARYYGGTNLGTGGLVRAYGGGVRGALEQTATLDKVDRVRLRISVGYEHADAVERLLTRMAAPVEDRSYTEVVRLTCGIDRELRAVFLQSLADATQGGAEVECDPDAA